MYKDCLQNGTAPTFLCFQLKCVETRHILYISMNKLQCRPLTSRSSSSRFLWRPILVPYILDPQVQHSVEPLCSITECWNSGSGICEKKLSKPCFKKSTSSKPTNFATYKVLHNTTNMIPPRAEDNFYPLVNI